MMVMADYSKAFHTVRFKSIIIVGSLSFEIITVGNFCSVICF